MGREEGSDDGEEDVQQAESGLKAAPHMAVAD